RLRASQTTLNPRRGCARTSLDFPASNRQRSRRDASSDATVRPPVFPARLESSIHFLQRSAFSNPPAHSSIIFFLAFLNQITRSTCLSSCKACHLESNERS